MKLHTTGNYEYDTADNNRMASPQTVEAAASHPMAEGEIQTRNKSDDHFMVQGKIKLKHAII